MQFLMFSKHLQVYPVEKAGELIKSLGFDGVDLTVRPGGHIDPQEVTYSLPRALRALEALGLSVPMITTAITSAGDPGAEKTFATAGECGVKVLKLGYWPYTQWGTLKKLLEETKRSLKGIEQLALRFGVQAVLHTHSGNFLTANPAFVAWLIKDYDSRALGAYPDPGHMAVEGGLSGWKMGLDLLKERTSVLAIKDFGWFREENKGPKAWTAKLVPLEEGITPWPEVFGYLRQWGWDGLVTFHSEYQGSHSFRDLSTEELLEQTRKDFHYLKAVIQALDPLPPS